LESVVAINAVMVALAFADDVGHFS
jgi:hypothetical protein